MTRREKRRLAVSVGITVAVAALLAASLWFQTLKTQQAAARDLFFQTWSPGGVRDIAGNTVIVAIDDASVAKLGRFTAWPRRHYAQFMDKLREAPARALAFDVGFLEPEADDPLVVEAISRFNNLGPEDLQRAGVPLSPRSVISPVIGTPLAGQSIAAGNPVAFTSRLQPDRYVAASTLLGHVNTLPDNDGAVRKTPLIVNAAGREYPSLALAAAAAYTNTVNLTCGGSLTAPDACRVPRDPEGQRLQALRRFVPVDDYFQMIISYAGPPSRISAPEAQTFKIVSFLDVIEGRVNPQVLRDKMVFIGALDLAGAADDYWVPTSPGVGKMAGVEVHANAFATLVSARFFADQEFPITVIWIFVLAVITGLAAARLSIIPSAVTTLGVAAGYGIGAQRYTELTFDQLGVAIPDLLYPPLAILVTFVAVTVYRVVFEQHEARVTRGAMGKYLSPAVLNEVLKDPDALKLGGEKRIMSALFSDIRGFTSVSEKLEPQELVALLNEYLTVMTDIVHDNQGVLDKYMGDCVMAWWGAPTDQPDHAYRACVTGLQMRAALKILHEHWDKLGVPKLEMGVGINTGPMVYGNTGSHERFDFTVLGDSVNLASRLEGANKEYASNVIISESTLADLDDHQFVTRYLDLIAVKGKTEPVGIYELLGISGQVEPQVADQIAAWDKGMELYKQQLFEEAAAAFEDVLEINPNDGPAQVYIERCREMAGSPPGAGWDGVFVMTHK